MEARKEAPKWKDYLLKSGLPLEHLVSERLEAQEFYICGEYRYTRPGAKESPTEFSVDLHAFLFLRDSPESHWGKSNLLVECKYHHPGVRWIFAPDTRGSLYIFTGGCISRFEDLTTYRIKNTAPLAKPDRELDICTRGVALHGTGCESKPIDEGLYQLRYAIPSFIAEAVREQIAETNEEDLHIAFLCPLLVTTASLHVLNEGMTLEAYQQAGSFDDISAEVDALVAFQVPGPEYRGYCDQTMTRLYRQCPEISDRLTQAQDILTPPGNEPRLPAGFNFQREFSEATMNLLVVRFNALDGIVHALRQAVEEAGRSRKRVAALSRDVTGRTRRLVGLPEGDK